MKRSDVDGIRWRIRANAPANWLALILPLAIAGSLGVSCRRGGPASDDPALDRHKQAGQRIEAAANAIDLAVTAPHAALATATPSPKPRAPATPPPPAEEEGRTIAFRVTGIFADEHAQLVMTSAGTAGLGEEVDGFKVVGIREDAVTFMDKQGRKVKVNLYKDESGP